MNLNFFQMLFFHFHKNVNLKSKVVFLSSSFSQGCDDRCRLPSCSSLRLIRISSHSQMQDHFAHIRVIRRLFVLVCLLLQTAHLVQTFPTTVLPCLSTLWQITIFPLQPRKKYHWIIKHQTPANLSSVDKLTSTWSHSVLTLVTSIYWTH